MQIAMPSMPQSLTYAIVAAIGITVLAAVIRAIAGPGNIVAALLLLALGCAFVLLQQGTNPEELQFGGVMAVAAPTRRIHLRMLEELRDAGILSEDEFAAKRLMVEP